MSEWSQGTTFRPKMDQGSLLDRKTWIIDHVESAHAVFLNREPVYPPFPFM
jgi:hypothetical protein